MTARKKETKQKPQSKPPIGLDLLSTPKPKSPSLRNSSPQTETQYIIDSSFSSPYERIQSPQTLPKQLIFPEETTSAQSTPALSASQATPTAEKTPLGSSTCLQGEFIASNFSEHFRSDERDLVYGLNSRGARQLYINALELEWRKKMQVQTCL